MRQVKVLTISLFFLVTNLPALALEETPDQAKPAVIEAISDSTDKTDIETNTESTKSKPLEISTEQEDINITYNRHLAQEQVKKYPDSAEAHFVLAVALTRSSQIEAAFKEIRIARRLAEKEGGPTYFDEMIGEYENMLTYYPEDNKVRYHLAWAYYMKAYLLAEYSKRVEKAKLATDGSLPQAMKAKEWHKQWVDSISEQEKKPEESSPNKDNNPNSNASKHLTAMEQVMKKAAPWAVPKIKQYYVSALSNLDDLLSREPKDVWARLYRAHLNAEYTGDLDSAMKAWKSVRQEHPTNPAAYFFIGEGYLKMGNLRKCLTNVSKAVALRAVGN